MSAPAYFQEFNAATAAAQAACEVLRPMYAAWQPMADAPINISTEADRASQEAILTTLQVQFPDDAYRAEEATPSLQGHRRDGERIWIVDPIDGTRGFAEKTGEFSVMIAFVVNGVLELGVVAEPASGRIFSANRGSHCCDGSKLSRVSGVDSLSAATMIQSHTKPGRPPSAAVQRMKPAKVVEMYSAGVKLARVACGEADLYVCDYPQLNDWDLAAGHILVEAAGGQVTKLDGSPIQYGTEAGVVNGGVIASNGHIHMAAVTAWQGGSGWRSE